MDVASIRRRINRHSTFVMLEFLFRSDWTLAARGGARVYFGLDSSEPDDKVVTAGGYLSFKRGEI